MTSVEVQPPLPTGDSGEAGPSSTYEWLAGVPVLSSAGSTIYGWYEGSKNYTRASKYALDSVESSVKYVADTAASVVGRPMAAVDSFAVKQLVKLEEKVPSIKTETDEVLEALDEQKKAVCSRLNHRKEAIAGRLADGKEAVTTRLTTSKDALVSALHAGTEVVANSGPAAFVGSGVGRTLQVTESLVDYLLPEKPEDTTSAGETEKEEVELETSAAVEDSSDDENEEEEEEGEGEGKEETNAERVKNISRKVKVRVYYRTLRRLDAVQEQCKATLELLKTNVDLLKMAYGAYEEVDKQYKHIQASLHNVRQHLGSLVTPHPTSQDPLVSVLDDNEEGEVQLESMTPTQKATLLQGVLDYTRQLSERVYTAFSTVSKATTFLPHNLKAGANHALEFSQELYTTLKSAKVPTDIPASVLNTTAEVIDAQLGYVKQLGHYIKTSLKAKEKSQSSEPTDPKTLLVPDQAQEDSSDSDEGGPPISRPPGDGEGEPPPSDPPQGEQEGVGPAETSLSSTGDEK